MRIKMIGQPRSMPEAEPRPPFRRFSAFACRTTAVHTGNAHEATTGGQPGPPAVSKALSRGTHRGDNQRSERGSTHAYTCNLHVGVPTRSVSKTAAFEHRRCVLQLAAWSRTSSTKLDHSSPARRTQHGAIDQPALRIASQVASHLGQQRCTHHEQLAHQRLAHSINHSCKEAFVPLCELIVLDPWCSS